jgi:hypothetical protein
MEGLLKKVVKGTLPVIDESKWSVDLIKVTKALLSAKEENRPTCE